MFGEEHHGDKSESAQDQDPAASHLDCCVDDPARGAVSGCDLSPPPARSYGCNDADCAKHYRKDSQADDRCALRCQI